MTTAGMFVYRCVMFYKIAKKINYCGQRPDSSIFTGLMEEVSNRDFNKKN
jgi:hypothetical protein